MPVTLLYKSKGNYTHTHINVLVCSPAHVRVWMCVPRGESTSGCSFYLEE